MTDSAGVTGVPTTVVVDVQNVHGVGGQVLGTRRKPNPEGIAMALRPLGFDVIGLDVPVGTPEENDLRHVIPRLSKQADRGVEVQEQFSVQIRSSSRRPRRRWRCRSPEAHLTEELSADPIQHPLATAPSAIATARSPSTRPGRGSGSGSAL